MAGQLPLFFSVMKTKIVSFVVGLTALLFVGCRPYMTPVFVNVENNQTAYVIPLEGVHGGEVKFDSVGYLEQKKVAAKRIELAQRWNQTGRFYFNGDYIPLQRVITVDRAPVNRQWEPGKQSKHALWMESSDSIGFSTGFSITALILEPDTSQFLWYYKGDSLSHVLDEEGRNRILSVAGKEAASYKMDDLRDKKNELIDKVRADIIPYFKERGITISTIGMFGGFEYENAEIQNAIDKTFIAQQVKVTNTALLTAQADENARIQSKAIADAEAIKSKGKGEAEAKYAVFDAEARGLRAVNEALTAANQNPALVELKRIDVQKLQAERWDGHYPTWYMGGANSPSLILSTTPPATATR
jgi:hypothetical protein